MLSRDSRLNYRKWSTLATSSSSQDVLELELERKPKVKESKSKSQTTKIENNITPRLSHGDLHLLLSRSSPLHPVEHVESCKERNPENESWHEPL